MLNETENFSMLNQSIAWQILRFVNSRSESFRSGLRRTEIKLTTLLQFVNYVTLRSSVLSYTLLFSSCHVNLEIILHSRQAACEKLIGPRWTDTATEPRVCHSYHDIGHRTCTIGHGVSRPYNYVRSIDQTRSRHPECSVSSVYTIFRVPALTAK